LRDWRAGVGGFDFAAENGQGDTARDGGGATRKDAAEQPKGCGGKAAAPNANGQRFRRESDWLIESGFSSENSTGNHWENFPTQSPVCRGDDGISDILDADALLEGKKPRGKFNAYSKWRTETLKAYGNAIVPEVALRIFQAIDTVNKEFNL
jgi:hypothetical protein